MNEPCILLSIKASGAHYLDMVKPEFNSRKWHFDHKI